MNEENHNQQPPNPTPPVNAPSQHTVMGILSYLGPLVIVSYIMSKDDPFVKFHIKQGLTLLSVEVLFWILGSLIWYSWPLIQILNLITFVLSVIGIVNVVQHKEKDLPIIGHFANHFFKF